MSVDDSRTVYLTCRGWCGRERTTPPQRMRWFVRFNALTRISSSAPVSFSEMMIDHEGILSLNHITNQHDA